MQCSAPRRRRRPDLASGGAAFDYYELAPNLDTLREASASQTVLQHVGSALLCTGFRLRGHAEFTRSGVRTPLPEPHAKAQFRTCRPHRDASGWSQDHLGGPQVAIRAQPMLPEGICRDRSPSLWAQGRGRRRLVYGLQEENGGA
eukprot:gene11085-biopygen10264